jgi:hypothetical protein
VGEVRLVALKLDRDRWTYRGFCFAPVVPLLMTLMSLLSVAGTLFEWWNSSSYAHHQPRTAEKKSLAHRYTRNQRKRDIKHQNLRRKLGRERDQVAERAQDRADGKVDRVDACQVKVDVLTGGCVGHCFLVTFDG